MHLRAETAADQDAITGVIGAAFAVAAHASGTEARNAAGCVVLGDPAYYTRFGFAPHAPLFYPDVPPEYFMALPLAGALPAGRVQYHPAFAVS